MYTSLTPSPAGARSLGRRTFNRLDFSSSRALSPKHVVARHVDPEAHVERARGALIRAADRRRPVAIGGAVDLGVPLSVLVAYDDRTDPTLFDPVREPSETEHAGGLRQLRRWRERPTCSPILRGGPDGKGDGSDPPLARVR